MERIEYKFPEINRSEWSRGAWDNEPDKIQWQDKETGLPCLIVRNKLGALCGYVGISAGHPLFEVAYSGCCLRENKCKGYYCDHSPESSIYVHGGLTFADFCHPHENGRGICHIPSPGEPDHVWWFGFDCAHSGDIVPGMIKYDLYEAYADYRTISYVQDQCRQLAIQLKAKSGA